jgi:hypothetical protein
MITFVLTNMKKIVLIAIMGLGFSVVAQAQTEAPAEVVATPAVEQAPTKKCCKGGDATAACQGQAQVEGTAAAPKKSCCQSGAAAAGSCQGHAQAEAAAPAGGCQGHAQASAEGTAAAPKKSCSQSAATGSCQGHAQAEAAAPAGGCQGHAHASAEAAPETETPATEAAVETAAPATPACQGSSEVKPCCQKKHD